MSNNTDTLLREFAKEHCSYLGADIDSWKKPIEEAFVRDLRTLLDKLMPTEEEIEDKAKKKYTRKEYQDVFIIACRWVRLIMKGKI